MGVGGVPQSAPDCLKCHVTGGGARWRPDRTSTRGTASAARRATAPGSEHAASVVADRVGGTRTPLPGVTEKTCLPCHRTAHGKPFVFATASAHIAHPTTPADDTTAVGRWTALSPQAAGQTLDEQYGMAASKGAKWFLDELAVTYKNPVNLAFRPDGREVWVACEASGTVVIVDAATRAKVGRDHGRRAGATTWRSARTARGPTCRAASTDTVTVVDVASAQGDRRRWPWATSRTAC